MGSCASTSALSRTISNDVSFLPPREFREPTPKSIISSEEVLQRTLNINSFVKIRDMSSSSDEVGKYFVISNVAQKKPQVCVRKQSFCSSHNSFNSSILSETFDSGNVLSYDGLNMRAENRDDIGMDILKAKIHFGANPNEMCTHGDRTCLMFAVLANDFNFTKKLVESGVDVNRTNSLGETALSLAIEMQNSKLTNYLRSKGAADVGLPSKYKIRLSR